jgi:periplasmic copper chaperone A
MRHWGDLPSGRPIETTIREPGDLPSAPPSTMARGVPRRRLSMRKILLSSALLSLGLACPAVAHHEGEVFQIGKLVISHAWMIENAAMEHSSSVYLTIDNQGTEADKLIGAEVDFADEAVFQAQTVDADGVLEVRDISGIKVNPDQVLTLKPGLLWIELESLHRRFEHGDHFDMTLTFEKAGMVEIEVEIEPADEHEHEKEETS